MSEELVERLRREADYKLPNKIEAAACIAAEAADRIEALQAEIERLTYDGIHTCHDDCPRLPCVQRREIDALQAEVAGLESWKVAEDAHHHMLLAEIRHLMNELQAHKDALAQVKGSSSD